MTFTVSLGPHDPGCVCHRKRRLTSRLQTAGLGFQDIPASECHDFGTRLPRVSSLCTSRDSRALSKRVLALGLEKCSEGGHAQGPVKKVQDQGRVPEGF